LAPRRLDVERIHHEHFEQDFGRFVEHLRRQGAVDVDLTAAHLNQRGDGDWRDAYTPELADRVHARFREDFDRFGYDRESWRSDGARKPGGPMVTIHRLEQEIFERNRVIALLNDRLTARLTARANARRSAKDE
jgi:hypothetical protein